jgi:protein tyrosine/serine phosphatase
VDKINGLPFVRAYWVVPGRVAAGNYPGDRNAEEAASKLAGLLESGLNTVINLMPVDESDRDGEPFVPYEDQFAEIAAANQTEVTCLRYPIADLSVPSPQQMRLILDAIDQSLARNSGVYVHCRAGIGRTGTVVGCFLIRHGLASGESVLERLAQLRSGIPGAEVASPETEYQIAMVTGWREGE